MSFSINREKFMGSIKNCSINFVIAKVKLKTGEATAGAQCFRQLDGSYIANSVTVKAKL
jgi:hypothetical protein